MEADVTLMELLEGLPDPRSARGKRHPLPALLGLAVVAMLAGMTSYEAIVHYGKERGWEFLKLLGFTTGWGLCKATYSRVFRRIDAADFEARVGLWIRTRLGPADANNLNRDGKTARGSRDGETPGVHLVAAYAPEVKAVLAQLRVDAKTNEHKAALELLGVLPIRGKVITGDALFTHRDVCAAIIDGGGDYVLSVKDNQPTLAQDNAPAFAEPQAGLSPPPGGAAPSRDRAGRHGRQGARPDRAASDRGDVVTRRVPRLGLARLRAGLPPGAATADRCEGRDRGGA